MKIVDRKTFLALPAGVIACQGQPWVFDGWFIKRGNCGDSDWFMDPIDACAFDNRGSSDMVDMLDAAWKNGSSVPLTFDRTERDGLFDDHALFAVMEQSDIDRLISVLSGARGMP